MEKYKESESVINFKVKENYTKVETILKTEFSVSSRLFSKLIRVGSIFLNGQVAHRRDTAKVGDVITMFLPDEEDINIKQSDIPLEILYEDDDLILINKQPDIVVHPTKNYPYDTILNGMSYYFEQNNIKKKVRLANRLDKDTSGVLVIAKNPFAHQQMSKQFMDDTVEKGYIAIVDGIVKSDYGIINFPIEREYEESAKRVVREDGKKSITKYRVIERYKNSTLLSLKLETGRTHQIRVHLKYIGHPIVGDRLYNSESPFINRQALHSSYLKFKTIRSGETIEIKAQLPQDMKPLIDIARIKNI